MVNPIETEEQYDKALERVYNLMQSDIVNGSPELDELDILSAMINEYELVHYPIEKQ